MEAKSYVRTCDAEGIWSTLLQESASSKSKLMVVSCMASWCGPCKSMDIYFEELARQCPEILFVKVDAGVLKRVVREMYIEGYPTYIMLEDGKEVGRVLGANKGDLLRMISTHPVK